MVIEHITRDRHQNADSLIKKTEFFDSQQQREADRRESKILACPPVFSFMDRETYDRLPLTRRLDRSGKPTEDHPELPAEHQEKTIMKRNPGMPMEVMLGSNGSNASITNGSNASDEWPTSEEDAVEEKVVRGVR